MIKDYKLVIDFSKFCLDKMIGMQNFMLFEYTKMAVKNVIYETQLTHENLHCLTYSL